MLLVKERAFMPTLQHKELKGFSPGANESSIVISTWKLSHKYALVLLGGRVGIYAHVTAQRIEGLQPW